MGQTTSFLKGMGEAGKDTVKVSGQAIVACAALVVFGIAAGAAGAAIAGS